MIAVMSDAPWSGDACSLVDAFRAGDRSPVEELRGDARRDRGERSERVLVPRFGPCDGRGPPGRRVGARSAECRSGVKELEPVAGWPATEASLVFRDRIATTTSPVVRRLFDDRRGRPRRAHDRERVRRTQRRYDQAQRRHPQSVAPRAHARWFVGRQRGRGRRRPRDARDRRRRRRVDSHPGRLHRAVRHEGHVRPDPAWPRRLVSPGHGRARVPGALGS